MTELTQGGKALTGLEQLLKSVDPHPPLIKKSNQLNRQKSLVDELEERLNKAPMPSKGADPQQKKVYRDNRSQLRKDIKNAKKKLTTVSMESKELINPDEAERLGNLSKRVGYTITDWHDLDPVTYTKEKGTLMLRAAQTYQGKARLGAKIITQLAGISEAIPYCQGSKAELKKAEPEIEANLNMCFIDAGMNDMGIENYINPWSALALTVCAPILGKAIENATKEINHERAEKKRTRPSNY